MNATAFDLGARLRAAVTHRPVARLYRPLHQRPVSPIAVELTHDDKTPTLTAWTQDQSASASGDDALRALADLGVSFEGDPRTLVTATRATVEELAKLARGVDSQGPLAEVAAVVAWWHTRSEHPGSGAVLAVIESLRDRWVLGVDPDDELSLETWAAWLGVGESSRGLDLLAFAHLVTQPRAGRAALDIGDSDEWSWKYAATSYASGSDWREPDDAYAAAMGLASRCHAVELFDSARGQDPLWALRAVWEGDVLAGEVVSVNAQDLEVITDQSICRLKVGSEVTGWAGEPQDIGRGLALTSARIERIDLTASGRLLIAVGRSVGYSRFSPGDRLSMTRKPTTAELGKRSRMLMSVAMRKDENWIGSRRGPSLARRTVPLDVVVAAANS